MKPFVKYFHRVSPFVCLVIFPMTFEARTPQLMCVSSGVQ